jgi:hypothetical protein
LKTKSSSKVIFRAAIGEVQSPQKDGLKNEMAAAAFELVQSVLL